MQTFDQIFSELDTDQDGMLLITQCYEVLSKLQINHYLGMLDNIFITSDEPGSEVKKVSRQNLKYYCNCSLKGLQFLVQLDSELKAMSLEFKEKIQQISQSENETAQAGPGLGQNFKEQNIKIDIQVGPETEHKNQIDLEITKSKEKKQNKPYVVITFTPKQDKSSELIQALEELKQSAQNLMNEEMEQFNTLTNSTQLDITQQGDKVVLRVQSDSPELNKSLENLTQFPDKLFQEQSVEGHLNFTVGTNIDFKNFGSGYQSSTLLDHLYSCSKVLLNYTGSSSLFKLYQNISIFTGTFQNLVQPYMSFRDFFQNYFLGVTLGGMEDIDINLKFKSLANMKTKLIEYMQNKYSEKNSHFQVQILEDLVQGMLWLRSEPAFAFVEKFLNQIRQCCQADINVYALVGKTEVKCNIVMKNIGQLFEKVRTEADSKNH